VVAVSKQKNGTDEVACTLILVSIVFSTVFLLFVCLTIVDWLLASNEPFLSVGECEGGKSKGRRLLIYELRIFHLSSPKRQRAHVFTIDSDGLNEIVYAFHY
jgi:hypothetical protein